MTQNTVALKTLYNVILQAVNDHPDNPQLLLFIGVGLNDVDIVKNCEKYDLDFNKGITARNKYILEQMGCKFDDIYE
tara:strand:- start:2013 stop:2243 length:231 start_codon:yes stop_codon:yes gene_type:complete